MAWMHGRSSLIRDWTALVDVPPYDCVMPLLTVLAFHADFDRSSLIHSRVPFPTVSNGVVKHHRHAGNLEGCEFSKVARSYL